MNRQFLGPKQRARAIQEKMKAYVGGLGFAVHPELYLPSTVAWRPDLVARKDDITFVFEIIDWQADVLTFDLIARLKAVAEKYAAERPEQIVPVLVSLAKVSENVAKFSRDNGVVVLAVDANAEGAQVWSPLARQLDFLIVVKYDSFDLPAAVR